MRTKTKTVLILLCFPILMGAQQRVLNKDQNLPRVGDELMKEQVAYFDPGEAGENLTWDLRNLHLTDNAYIVHYFTRDNWKIIEAENGKLNYHSISGDSLLIDGYESPQHLVKYSQPGLLLHFPIEFGSISKGQFQGRGKHHDRLESVVFGEIKTTADAVGSLILPGNDTLHCVIRVHIRKNETARYIPVSSEFAIDRPSNDSLFLNSEPETIITDTYQWYEEGYRYPVLEAVETYRNTLTGKILLSRDAYFYHPAEQAYLPEDAANRAALELKASARNAKMLEKEENILSFQCYPNPVKEHLTTELNFRESVTVEVGLWDMSGRLIRQFPMKSDVTFYRENLDLQSFPRGYYLVKVIAGDETVSRKIVKN